MEGFSEAAEIIPPIQHGFRSGRSVLTTLAETWDDFTGAFDKRHNVDCIYFDIKSAFDSVDHTLLLQKLVKFGYGPNTVSWLESFLLNRRYSVKIGSHISNSEVSVLGKGVPQGGVLSPYLFNLFISDLPKFSYSNVTIKQYADDVKAYVSYPDSKSDVTNNLQAFIDHFSNWCENNGLLISIDKLKVLYLGNSNPKRAYTISGFSIPSVTDSVRDLGIFFTPSLKFDHHVSLKCRAAYFKWFNLFKFFKTKDPLILVRLYKVYVRPTLEFGSIIFNNGISSLDCKLETVQRKITRMILRRSDANNPIPPYPERCTLLKLQSLKLRRDIFDLSFFHTIHQNPDMISKINLPQRINHRFPRRRKGVYQHSHVRTTLRRNSFLVRVPKIYNLIPTNLRSFSDNKIFKLGLSNFLSTQNFRSI